MANQSSQNNLNVEQTQVILRSSVCLDIQSLLEGIWGEYKVTDVDEYHAWSMFDGRIAIRFHFCNNEQATVFVDSHSLKWEVEDYGE